MRGAVCFCPLFFIVNMNVYVIRYITKCVFDVETPPLSLSLCTEDAGTYFPSVKREPGRYLQPCSDAVKTWLRSMKSAGKVLLLITSSHSDYCRLICDHILG